MRSRPSLVALFTLTLLVSFASAQEIPRLTQQTPVGETNPLCCVVAVSARGGFPLVFVGEPIPVAPGAFNYMGVMASMVPDYETVRIILDRGGIEHREFYGTAYPMPGWPGLTTVLAFAPDDLNGEYRIRIRYAAHNSAPLLIRFISPQPIAIDRGDLARPRSGRPR